MRKENRKTGYSDGKELSITSGSSFRQSFNRVDFLRLLPLVSILFVGVAGCLSGPLAFAQAPVTLVSNMMQMTDSPNVDEDTLWARDEYVLAISFVTGPSDADWLLSAVDLDIEQWQSGITPTVSIYDANASWEPVSSLTVLTNPSRGTGIRTFSAPNPVILQASSHYSVVVRSTATTEGDAFVLRGTYSDDDDAGGQTGWTIDTFTRLSTDHTRDPGGERTRESCSPSPIPILIVHATNRPAAMRPQVFCVSINSGSWTARLPT